jgi:molecular chaperone HscC
MTLVGIDLGTTYSSVARLADGRPQVLADERGSTLMPSAVAVAKDGALLVGSAAWDRLAHAPAAGRAFFKRDMGTSATYRFGGRKWTPTECSALVLSEMKRVAERALGRPVTEAVVTVPAYFREPQRQATCEAAAIAGLGVQRIVNEPTAAALAYGYRDPGREARLLVFDLGGGTFDVTLLHVYEGVIEVLATGGESQLGGEDYTDALLDHLVRQGGVRFPAKERGFARHEVEGAKRRLSVRDPVAIVLRGHELIVRRADLEQAGGSLTARMVPVVRRCLRDAGLAREAIDEVLLVGGATRMPLVHDLLRRELGVEGRSVFDPDQVVALGAAVQAALCADDEAVEDLVLTDVCAHTLGIEVSKELAPDKHEPGYFAPLIDRNTTIPVSRAKVFSTIHPFQDELEVVVYQGESRRVADNQRLGRLQLKNLRQGDVGGGHQSVEVRFSYDMNGLLEVEATALRTGKKERILIERRPGALTSAQVEAAMRRLAPLKVRARDRVPNRARLERAYRLYTQLSGLAREQLAEQLDVFESALESGDPSAVAYAGEVLDRLLADHPFEEGEWQPDADEEPPR